MVGGLPWDDRVVLDACSMASAAGIYPGMRLAQAEILCPDACFRPANETAYRTAHDALVAAASRFSPIVETAKLGQVYVQVDGLERLIGPDRVLGGRLLAAAERASGLAVSVGIAANKFTAEQAACMAPPGGRVIVAPGEERSFLSPLSVNTLPADLEMLRQLALLGLNSLGALATLPRVALVHQFGPHAGPLHDLACGLDPRPVQTSAPPLAFEQGRDFEEPSENRTLLLAHAYQMASALSETLAQRGYQAEGVQLQLEESSGSLHTRGMPVKPPSADTQKLTRLTGRLLEQIDPQGPITRLTLTTFPLRPAYLGAVQLTFFDKARDDRGERLRQVLRGLRTRFGELVLVMAALVGPPPPSRIQVATAPDGTPRTLVWRDRLHPVVAIYESWRERRRWWGRPVERDYYRLETADGHVRVIFQEVQCKGWLLERRRL